MMRRLFLLLCSCLLLGTPRAFAEEPAPQRRVVIAGAWARASWWHELLLGAEYRDLWTAPFSIEVLDLDREAGGLKPVKRVGGMQTLGLALAGKDGLAYTFRGLDKDLAAALSESIKNTFVGELVQDQLAASHPAGTVIAPVFLEAAGVLHVKPRFVLMPDDPRLGEFRGDFAGKVGTFELYPRDGFAGSLEVIDATQLYQRLEGKDGDRVDATAFLRARLVDFYLGDWDRHRRQWRWARMGEDRLWLPIPEDRDQAFVRYEGLLPFFARMVRPKLVRFGAGIPGMEGLTYNGREQDRWLLAPLDRDSFEVQAREVAGAITDEVVDRAVAAMPPEYQAIEGERFARTLRARRERLADAAERYFRHLAREVDVHLTGADEQIAVAHDRGTLELTVQRAGAAAPWLARQFRSRFTREVRLYLHGGADRVVTKGLPSGVRLRVIAAGGSPEVDDSAGGETRFYDPGGQGRLIPGPGSRLIRKPDLRPPPDPEAPWIPARDWGKRVYLFPWLSVVPDLGLFLGASWIQTRYGFRKEPWASRDKVLAGFATGASAPRLRYQGVRRLESSPVFFSLDVLASGIEIVRFYGLGNESRIQGNDRFHRAVQREGRLSPAVGTEVWKDTRVSFGTILRFSSTSFSDDSFLKQTRPYGSGSFGQMGLVAQFEVASQRDNPEDPPPLRAEIGGSWWPAIWDVRSPFGEVHGQVRTRLGLGPLGELWLRAGGRKVWGDYPFQESAFLGGADSLRGYRNQRFAGDAELHAGSELRLRLGKFRFPIPGDFGVFALADTGRVWREGERSRRWHTGVGGGLWAAPFGKGQALSLAVARSDERTAIYFAVELDL